MENIIGITDFSAKELDIYARLTEAQLLNKDCPQDGLFIAESPKVVLRALDAGYELFPSWQKKGIFAESHGRVQQPGR